MPDQETPIIDMRKEIHAIKNKHGDKYHFKPEAYQEAADLWGFSNHNDCGVVTKCRTETIAEIKSCTAELRLAESDKGYWLFGLSAMTSVSGSCYMPSVMDSTGFHSYGDVRLAGVIQLLRFFESESDYPNSCGGKSHIINCQEMIKILEAEKQPQLDMFASLGGAHGR